MFEEYLPHYLDTECRPVVVSHVFDVPFEELIKWDRLFRLLKVEFPQYYLTDPCFECLLCNGSCDLSAGPTTSLFLLPSGR